MEPHALGRRGGERGEVVQAGAEKPADSKEAGGVQAGAERPADAGRRRRTARTRRSKQRRRQRRQTRLTHHHGLLGLIGSETETQRDRNRHMCLFLCLLSPSSSPSLFCVTTQLMSLSGSLRDTRGGGYPRNPDRLYFSSRQPGLGWVSRVAVREG